MAENKTTMSREKRKLLGEEGGFYSEGAPGPGTSNNMISWHSALQVAAASLEQKSKPGGRLNSPIS